MSERVVIVISDDEGEERKGEGGRKQGQKRQRVQWEWVEYWSEEVSFRAPSVQTVLEMCVRGDCGIAEDDFKRQCIKEVGLHCLLCSLACLIVCVTCC